MSARLDALTLRVVANDLRRGADIAADKKAAHMKAGHRADAGFQAGLAAVLSTLSNLYGAHADRLENCPCGGSGLRADWARRQGAVPFGTSGDPCPGCCVPIGSQS